MEHILFPMQTAREKKRKSNFRKSHTQNFKKKSKIYTVLYIEPSSVAPYPQSMAQNMPQSPKLYWYGGIFDDLLSYTEQFCIPSHQTAQCAHRAVVRLFHWHLSANHILLSRSPPTTSCSTSRLPKPTLWLLPVYAEDVRQQNPL